MNPLQISSCLFATIVVHTYYRQMGIYHHIFLALTVTSILFHTTHTEIIRILDKILAHMCFILIVMDTPKAVEAKSQWLLIFPFIVLCLWVGQSLITNQRVWMHFWLHMTSVVGVHAYLWTLYKN